MSRSQAAIFASATLHGERVEHRGGQQPFVCTSPRRDVHFRDAVRVVRNSRPDFDPRAHGLDPRRNVVERHFLCKSADAVRDEELSLHDVAVGDVAHRESSQHNGASEEAEAASPGWQQVAVGRRLRSTHV